MKVGWGFWRRRDSEWGGIKEGMRDNDQNTQFTCTRLSKNKYRMKTATKNNGLPRVRNTLPAPTSPSRLEESDDKHASALFS